MANPMSKNRKKLPAGTIHPKQPPVGAYPKISPFVLQNSRNQVGTQASRSAGIGPEIDEMIPIVANQPGIGANPDKPLFVVANGRNARQSLVVFTGNGVKSNSSNWVLRR